MAIINITNFEKTADPGSLRMAMKLLGEGRVISVASIEVNETIGTMYEGKIKVGRKVHTLCFAIDMDGIITCDNCFCPSFSDKLCEHFLAILLYMKYKKNITIDKRVFSPVKVILSSADTSLENVDKTVDNIYARYIVNNKISAWYMPYAIEGFVFACLCAEDKEKSFAERTALYALALKKADKLFSLSAEKYPRILIIHTKSLVRLATTYLTEKLPGIAINECRKAFNVFYETSKSVRNWTIKYNTLGLLVQFCETPSLRIFLERDFKKKIAYQKDPDKKSDVRILYCMVLRAYSMKLAASYIEKNLSDPSFRRMAIELNIANGDYREAKRLAKDGLKTDRGDDKKSAAWTEVLYNIGENAHDTRAMKAYARKMLLLGDFDYYVKYKKLFDEDEWLAVRNELIQTLRDSKKHREIYLQIIIEENIQDELIAFCRQNPEKIANYYPYVHAERYTEIVGSLENYLDKLKTTKAKSEDIMHQKIVLEKLKTKTAR